MKLSDKNGSRIARVANRISEIFANDEADEIVITHGTDMQEETAYILSLTVTLKKPIVIKDL